MPAAISVCLPVYNGSSYLGQAIESVLNQSEPDFELLIADDCSKDNSFEIARNYALQDPRVKVWKNERNLGLFANYNQCLQRAGAPLLKPFAQDDVLEPNALKAMRYVLDNHQSVVLVSSARHAIDAAGAPLPEALSVRRHGPPWRPIPGAQIIRESLFPVENKIGEPATVMFRGSVCGQGFDESFHHLGDLEYWLRILRQGDYYYIDDSLCAFRIHDLSRSRDNLKSLAFAPDLLRIAESFKDEIQATGSQMDSYVGSCIIWLADHLEYMRQTGELDDQDVLGPQPALDSRPKMSSEFRQIAYLALRIIANRNSTESNLLTGMHIGQRALLVRCREKTLRTLMRSKSWRCTKPLRDIKRSLLNPTIAESGSDASLGLDGCSTADQQQLYLRYLRKKILEIRSSASWRVTAPFRAIKL